jgi:hypothetical protein
MKVLADMTTDKREKIFHLYCDIGGNTARENKSHSLLQTRKRHYDNDLKRFDLTTLSA